MNGSIESCLGVSEFWGKAWVFETKSKKEIYM